MTATALPENYCICVGDDGAPRELGRSGTAVTYKAMGYQSGRAIALQLIPLANVTETGRAQFELKVRALWSLKHPNIARVFDVREEDEHLVFATEFLQGETAERWVVTHGPMPADAVLRIGLQVVSALAEAAFHSLSHRAIQPSNLMIVTGASPDGNWPFVKLLHFGLAGLKLYSDGKEVVPAIGPAFASPEQLETGKVDFPSEIFSLGATMCFLLTGDVPLTGRTRKSGHSERTLPRDVPMPRPVRHLLRRMLRIDPEDRPHDPLLVNDELRACLKKVERRRAFRRPVSLPIEVESDRTAVDKVGAIEAEPRDRPRVFATILTGLTVLLLLGAFGMILLPGEMRWWTQRNRSLDSIGVPIGVDENSPVNEPVESASPAPAAESSPLTTPSRQEETERIVAEQPVTSMSPSPANSVTPEQSAAPRVTPEQSAPVIAENSAATEEATPAATVDSSANSSPSPVVENSSPAPRETEAPVPAESPSATPAETNQEPSPPGEGPPNATASPPPEVVLEKPAIARPEPPPVSEQNSEPSAAPPPAPKPATQKTAKTISPTRRIKSDTSRRKARKAKAPPRALPVDDRPPVIVLPPEN
jgi:serine/threonine-protein kinase